jgi:hypothetical protein
MIYVFGTGRNISVIYKPETLTEKDKMGGIAFEGLPPENTPEGHNAILALDKNNKLYWIYEPVQEVVEETIPE